MGYPAKTTLCIMPGSSSVPLSEALQTLLFKAIQGPLDQTPPQRESWNPGSSPFAPDDRKLRSQMRRPNLPEGPTRDFQGKITWPGWSGKASHILTETKMDTSPMRGLETLGDLRSFLTQAVSKRPGCTRGRFAPRRVRPLVEPTACEGQGHRAGTCSPLFTSSPGQKRGCHFRVACR